ncbi:hypothetical protein LshimejAT787_2900130 [Lyophyllum shimeji]|uniref:Peptidase A2 domain-containing protein n=1 Tax=Lyophyllum shimeji TaxID=47721 RepID=A0A9P3Q193_LYOSH|nr:hypothetical protein LshimejAT787_2900130 [Lyophyllum shimeji]
MFSDRKLAKRMEWESMLHTPHDESISSGEMPPPPPPYVEIVTARKARSLPEGYSSLGSRALHIKAHVGAVDQAPIQGRLDSGADITLMSEEYWKSIPGLPTPKEGMRIKLYHLTGHTKVLGYIKTTLYAETADHRMVSFELEAYIVCDMKVPLLLGEDFQTTYELGLTRHVTGHCEVIVGDSDLIIPASSAQQVDLGFVIRKAFNVQSFVRAKAVRRHRVRAKDFGHTDPPVTASKDILVTAESVHNVPVEAPFGEKKKWIVEKVIIGDPGMSVMAAPTIWISADAPYLPITNPLKIPWYIRKGDIVGYLKDPDTFADKPATPKEWDKYAASAEALKAVIEGSLRAQDLANAQPPDASAAEDLLESDDAWGPKTTALPNEPMSGDIAELVNLGPDIPEDIKPKLAEVLWKNRAAFGLDGRMEKVAARVDVPLQPGTAPISVPMYGASPAKWEIIEKQVNTWFEAGVIEPSKSPWRFPVVVVYRNGKPCLVVDYRKLNAKTVPDEFPIPRQSEII